MARESSSYLLLVSSMTCFVATAFCVRRLSWC